MRVTIIQTFYQEGSKLFFGNGVYLGEILTDVDGFKKWWPEHREGYLDSGFLLALGTYLELQNAAWEAEIQEAFK